MGGMHVIGDPGYVAGFRLGVELLGVLGVAGIGLLEAWWTHPSPPVQRGRVTPSPDGQGRCPYCHEGLGGDQAEAEQVEDVATLSCATCHVGHHAACWATHGGCSVYGCRPVGRAPRTRARVPAG